jgi:hypothetical protein
VVKPSQARGGRATHGGRGRERERERGVKGGGWRAGWLARSLLRQPHGNARTHRPPARGLQGLAKHGGWIPWSRGELRRVRRTRQLSVGVGDPCRGLPPPLFSIFFSIAGSGSYMYNSHPWLSKAMLKAAAWVRCLLPPRLMAMLSPSSASPAPSDLARWTDPSPLLVQRPPPSTPCRPPNQIAKQGRAGVVWGEREPQQRMVIMVARPTPTPARATPPPSVAMGGAGAGIKRARESKCGEMT